MQIYSEILFILNILKALSFFEIEFYGRRFCLILRI